MFSFRFAAGLFPFVLVSRAFAIEACMESGGAGAENALLCRGALSVISSHFSLPLNQNGGFNFEHPGTWSGSCGDFAPRCNSVAQFVFQNQMLQGVGLVFPAGNTIGFTVSTNPITGACECNCPPVVAVCGNPQDDPAAVVPPGEGTSELNPVRIYNHNALRTVATDPAYADKHIDLCANIDLTDKYSAGFKYFKFSNDFSGTFDGNGLTISGFKIADDSFGSEIAFNSPLGLFGRVNKGKVRDLNLIDVEIDAGNSDFVGALAGKAENSSLENLNVKAQLKARNFSGLVLGEAISSTLKRVDANGEVSASGASQSVGGIVGNAFGTNPDFTNIENVKSAVKVSAPSASNVGGMVGSMKFTKLKQVIAVTPSEHYVLSSGDSVGGLVGLADESSVTDYIVTAPGVMGGSRVGGVIGEIKSGVLVTHGYSAGGFVATLAADKQGYVGGLVGAVSGGGNQINSSFSHGGLIQYLGMPTHPDPVYIGQFVGGVEPNNLLSMNVRFNGQQVLDYPSSTLFGNVFVVNDVGTAYSTAQGGYPYQALASGTGAWTFVNNSAGNIVELPQMTGVGSGPCVD